MTSSANSHYSDDNEEAEISTRQQTVTDDSDEKGTILKKITHLQQNTNKNEQQQDQFYLMNQQQPLTNNNKRALDHLELNNSDNENINDDELKQNLAVTTPKKKKTKQNDSLINKNDKQKNLNINEIIEQMKHSDNVENMCQSNPVQNQSIINTTDFDLRLNDTKQTKTTKPRKYSKKDKEDPENKNDKLKTVEETKPIVKRRKSMQKNDQDIKDSNRGRKTSSNKNKNKQEDDESTGQHQTTINLSTIEDHSSCSTSSQQDEEIKELLARKNDSFAGIILNNENNSRILTVNQQNDLQKSKTKPKQNDPQKSASPSISFANKIITDELKELIQKEKQTTADLFLQLQILKNKEDNLNTNNFVNNFSNNMNYMHQNSNSSDISISELSNLNSKDTNQQFAQRIKSATPIFVDQLLMSPLFNSFMPSCGSSSSSNSSTSTNTIMQQTNSVVTSFSQMAAAVSAVLNNTNNNNSNKTTPSSSPTINESSLIKISSNQSSIKRTKENIKNNQTNKTNKQINSSCINALRFDTNSNGSYDELINLSSQNQETQAYVNKNSKMFNANRNSPLHKVKMDTANKYINRVQTTRTENETENVAIHQETNELDRRQTPISSSPPPPPPIGTPVIAAAPSPTKLPQFYPYSNNNSHIMHRPIPILQKADAALSSLINNLTSSSSLSLVNQSQSDLNKSQQLKNVNNVTSNETLCDSQTLNDSQNMMNKTPTCDLNELIKMNNQQQLISSLRSNSINNNSPLMFNNHFGMNFNSNNSANNNLLSSYASNSGTNVKLFFYLLN